MPTGFTLAAAGAPGDATVTIASDPTASPANGVGGTGRNRHLRFTASLADPLPTSPVTNTATNTDATTLPGTDPEERDEPDVQDGDQIELPLIEVDKSAALAPGGDADSSGTVSPGDILRYTVTVTNSGTGAATNVVLTDPITDLNLTLVAGSVTADGGGVVVVGNAGGDSTVQVDWASLPGPSSTVVTFDVVIANPVPVATSQVVNWATVASDELPDEPSDDPSTPADDDPTVVPLDAAPDVAVTKTDGVATASPGDTLTYVVTIENLGNTIAPNVTVTDMLPEHTTFLSASNGGAETSPGQRGRGVAVLRSGGRGLGHAASVTVEVDNPLAIGVLI